MLCQFTVKNYKSLRDETTFDMQATKISEHQDTLITTIDGQQFLPVSSIYGPNGGGKSNVLEAMEALCAAVVGPVLTVKNNKQVYGKIAINPFLFSEEAANMPTEFEVFFRTKLAEYRYQLTLSCGKVIFESLDRVKLDTKRRSGLFVRDNGIIDLKGSLVKLKISQELSDSLPLLSYLGITYMKNDVINDVLYWFENQIDFLNYGNPQLELKNVIDESVEVKELFLGIIKEMDLDIEDFRVEEQGKSVKVFTKHVVGNYSTEILLSEESSGTKKLFGMLPFIANSLKNGTVLVVDELDAKIHPVLLKYIIGLFTDKTVNKNGGQLIFTSHDLSSMNSDVFRRDEIWFVAKGVQQESKLYSLVEFKDDNGDAIRKDAKYDKQYLEGRYGADPYLRRIINWGDVNNGKE